jgi:hypothetical protein
MADSLVPRRTPLLDGLMTSVGPIFPARLQRLRRVLTMPTQETCDDAYSIILRHEPKPIPHPLEGGARGGPGFPPREAARRPLASGARPLARALRYAREAKPRVRG